MNQVLVQQAVIKMRREIKKFYLKEVNDILSNETSTTNDFLGRTTVSKNIKKSSTIAGNLEKINYIGVDFEEFKNRNLTKYSYYYD